MDQHLLKIAIICENLKEANEEINYQIACTSYSGKFCDWSVSKSEHRYTDSMDCSLMLIPADEYWRVGNDGDGPDPSAFKATVTSHDSNAEIHFHDAYATTGALALTAAALRAKAQQA